MGCHGPSFSLFCLVCFQLTSFPSHAEICLALPFLAKLRTQTQRQFHNTQPSICGFSLDLRLTWTSVLLPPLPSYPRGTWTSHFCIQTSDCLYPTGVSDTVLSPVCYISATPTSTSGLSWVHSTPPSLPTTLTQATQCQLSKEVTESRQEGVKGRGYQSGKSRPRLKITLTCVRSESAVGGTRGEWGQL